ncbi:transcriptional repressor [Patescibacteria group bacterium]|nr:transcriptional repressor [Patescibacteria group bacterium]
MSALRAEATGYNHQETLMRLTTHRKEILDYLTHSREALSASALHSALPHINLVTIYRALDYLVAESAVKKVHLAGDEAFFEVQHEPHHHAVCTECGKVIHFTTNDAELAKEFSLPGFIISDLEVSISGRCRSHAKK